MRRRFDTWPEGHAPAGYFPSPLPTDAAGFYAENGFLVALDAFSPDEVAALNQEAAAICASTSPTRGLS